MTEVLNEQIIKELFDIRFKASDIVVMSVADELERYGYNIDSTYNYDHAVVVNFSNDCFDCELRINRIFREFVIQARSTCGIWILPNTGDWITVMHYLDYLTTIKIEVFYD